MTTVATRTIELVHERDPVEAILAGVRESVKAMHPTGQNVLFVIYERERGVKDIDAVSNQATGQGAWDPKHIPVAGVTKGGIYLAKTSSATSEDKFMGNVGIIVAVGPRVAELETILGRIPKVGDLIMFRDTDVAVRFTIKPDYPGRDMEGQMIREFIDDPDVVM